MKYPSLLWVGLALTCCVPVSYTDTSTQKTISFTDQEYENNVGMVQLHPLSSTAAGRIEYPVIELGAPGMQLEFDLLEENSTYLNARYLHCNADWTQSNLNDLEFLKVYNEFPINQYNYSANTLIPYVNYKVALPSPSKSGNYVLVVYRENNKQDVLFTRRFLVFEQRAVVEVDIAMSSNVSKRPTHQQLEFGIRYKGIQNPNPLREFKVVLLQNHNWHQPITGLQPTLIRADQNYLEYRHFSGENLFAGLNEFRFFDLRSIDFRGMNVASVTKGPNQVQAHLGLDKSRGEQAYSQLIDDLNGGYFLENRDPDDSQLQSEYVQVFFQLQTEKVDGEVYIAGRHNNWVLGKTNRMTYDEPAQSYKGWQWMKQGYYDYFYWVKSDTEPFYTLEGSHFQASNSYEVLFYYRDPFKNYDELIGYRNLSSGN